MRKSLVFILNNTIFFTYSTSALMKWKMKSYEINSVDKGNIFCLIFDHEPTEMITSAIPYMKELSEKIARTFNTKDTDREKLMKVKPDNENQRTKDCVYEIPC